MSEMEKWNREGLIPGPNETEAEFVARAQFCHNLQTELVNLVGAELPFEINDQASHEIKQASLDKGEKLYGIAPTWVPIFFNNYQLAPWHGGCAWIFKLNETTPTAAFLQLRASFRQKNSFFGLYHREELIPHELAHVGRMMYNEPQFEELLAYRSSSSPWRRSLGPIVQSSKESLFFILLLGFIVLANLAMPSIGLGLSLLPVGLIMLALGRLIYRQIIYKRCLDRLRTFCETPEHLIYRLTDKEITHFSRLSPEEIKKFVAIEASKSFRWHFLASIYFS